MFSKWVQLNRSTRSSAEEKVLDLSCKVQNKNIISFFDKKYKLDDYIYVYLSYPFQTVIQKTLTTC